MYIMAFFTIKNQENEYAVNTILIVLSCYMKYTE